MERYEEVLTRMKQAFAQQAGYAVEEGSDAEIRMQVLAGEIYSGLVNAQWLKRQMFPQTAQGEYLTMHGQEHGLQRKQAQCATGNLTFARTSALSYDLLIPKGTVCAVSKEDTVRYVTTQAATLPANSLSVTVPAQAQQGGVCGNTAANTVKVMITVPAGVQTVTNEAAFCGGADDEGDAAFRARLLAHCEAPATGANAAFYRALALQHPQVYSVGVVPKENGVGTVSVYVAAMGGVPDADVIAELQAQFDNARELNTAVTVQAAAVQKIPLRLRIKVAPGYTFAQAKAACLAVIDDYFMQLQIGGTFRIAALCGKLLETGAVDNYAVDTGADLKLAQNRLAMPGSITIEEGSDLS